MTKVWRRCWLAVLLCLTLCQMQAHAQERLHIRSADVLNVEGGGDTAPYEANEAGLQGAWQAVTLPYMPQPDGSASPSTPTGASTVVTWYRLNLPELPPTAAHRTLYLPRWQSNGLIAVYADQRRLFQSNSDLRWNGWSAPLWIPLNEAADEASPRHIYLRISHPRNAGGGISTVWLGDGSVLSWRYNLRFFLQVRMPFMCSIAFLMAGFFSLLLWFRKNSETLHLLFFLMSLTSAVRTVHHLVGNNPLFMPWAWFQWWDINTLLWLIVVAHFFLNQLHMRPSTGLNRSVMACLAIMGILTLPLFGAVPHSPLPWPLVQGMVLVVGVIVGAQGIRQSQQVQSLDGKLLSAWCWMIVLLGLNDWLLQVNRLDMEDGYLGPYANFVAFLIFLFIMVRRYTGAVNAVRQLNANLSQRLAEREAELQTIYAQQREAEHRQTLIEERQRMMQDMHDGMGSSLRTALLAVEAGQLGATTVAEVLKDCIDDLKLAIDAMEPVQADLLLLLATLRFRLGPRLEAAGIALRWQVENVPDLDWLDPRNALHILRILQEVFTNIIKHTHATEIRVTTAIEGDAVVVALRDNGPGFDVALGLSNPGKGLNNQLRRAQAIGAEIHWDSSPAGVCVRLHLPIHRA